MSADTSRPQPVEVAELLAGPIDPDRVYWVRPEQLTLGPNVRLDAQLDDAFAESIRERGVLQPIITYVAGDELMVHMGQRRTLEAALAGVDAVRVLIGDRPDEADRLVDQLSENEHRASLLVGERAAGVQQLALLGIKPAQIARRTALPRPEVDDALAVAASPTAATAAAAHPELDLAQLAVLDEFADDPVAVQALVAAAANGRGTWYHALQLARDERRDRQDRQTVLDELAAAGVRVLEQPDFSTVRDLRTLGISPSKHSRCPGHAGYAAQDGRYVDGRHEPGWGPQYVCTEPRQHRGPASPAPAARATPTLQDSVDEQRRAAEAALDRAWRSAERVRRAWLGNFAGASGPLPGAAEFVAAGLLRGDVVLRRALDDGHELLRHLLLGQHQRASRHDDLALLTAQLAVVGPRRALRLACAALLAAWETRTGPHTWRQPGPEDRWYLGQMVQWGYPPSDIELRVLAEDTEPTGASR